MLFTLIHNETPAETTVIYKALRRASLVKNCDIFTKLFHVKHCGYIAGLNLLEKAQISAKEKKDGKQND